MLYRCVNPSCNFAYDSMRAICAHPACLDSPVPGCGRYFRFEPDGSVVALAPDAMPLQNDPNIAWLCCYCAMEYEVAGPGQVRQAPDPFAFVWRWQIEHGEHSVAHELG